MPESYDFLTAQQIATPSKSEAINSSSSQLTALQDEQLAEFFHTLNSDFVLAAHTEDHKKGWSWMKRSHNFSVVNHNALAAAVSAGDATFALSSAADWDNAGRTLIRTNRGGMVFVDHESKASNTLTVSTVSGAQTIPVALAAGSQAFKLYAAPSDFGRAHQLWVNESPFEPEQFTGRFPNQCRFALFGQSIFLPRGMASADASLIYEKAPTNIANLNTTTNIPRRFLRWAVYATLFHLYQIRRKRGDLKTTYEMMQIELQKALNYDSIQSSTNRIRLA